MVLIGYSKKYKNRNYSCFMDKKSRMAHEELILKLKKKNKKDNEKNALPNNKSKCIKYRNIINLTNNEVIDDVEFVYDMEPGIRKRLYKMFGNRLRLDKNNEIKCENCKSKIKDHEVNLVFRCLKCNEFWPTLNEATDGHAKESTNSLNNLHDDRIDRKQQEKITESRLLFNQSKKTLKSKDNLTTYKQPHSRKSKDSKHSIKEFGVIGHIGKHGDVEDDDAIKMKNNEKVQNGDEIVYIETRVGYVPHDYQYYKGSNKHIDKKRRNKSKTTTSGEETKEQPNEIQKKNKQPADMELTMGEKDTAVNGENTFHQASFSAKSADQSAVNDKTLSENNMNSTIETERNVEKKQQNHFFEVNNKQYDSTKNAADGKISSTNKHDDDIKYFMNKNDLLDELNKKNKASKYNKIFGEDYLFENEENKEANAFFSENITEIAQIPSKMNKNHNADISASRTSNLISAQGEIPKKNGDHVLKQITNDNLEQQRKKSEPEKLKDVKVSGDTEKNNNTITTAQQKKNDSYIEEKEQSNANTDNTLRNEFNAVNIEDEQSVETKHLNEPHVTMNEGMTNTGYIADVESKESMPTKDLDNIGNFKRNVDRDHTTSEADNLITFDQENSSSYATAANKTPDDEQIKSFRKRKHNIIDSMRRVVEIEEGICIESKYSYSDHDRVKNQTISTPQDDKKTSAKTDKSTASLEQTAMRSGKKLDAASSSLSKHASGIKKTVEGNIMDNFNDIGKDSLSATSLTAVKTQPKDKSDLIVGLSQPLFKNQAKSQTHSNINAGTSSITSEFRTPTPSDEIFDGSDIKNDAPTEKQSFVDVLKSKVDSNKTLKSMESLTQEDQNLKSSLFETRDIQITTNNSLSDEKYNADVCEPFSSPSRLKSNHINIGNRTNDTKLEYNGAKTELEAKQVDKYDKENHTSSKNDIDFDEQFPVIQEQIGVSGSDIDEEKTRNRETNDTSSAHSVFTSKDICFPKSFTREILYTNNREKITSYKSVLELNNITDKENVNKIKTVHGSSRKHASYPIISTENIPYGLNTRDTAISSEASVKLIYETSVIGDTKTNKFRGPKNKSFADDNLPKKIEPNGDTKDTSITDNQSIGNRKVNLSRKKNVSFSEHKKQTKQKSGQSNSMDKTMPPNVSSGSADNKKASNGSTTFDNSSSSHYTGLAGNYNEQKKMKKIKRPNREEYTEIPRDVSRASIRIVPRYKLKPGFRRKKNKHRIKLHLIHSRMTSSDSLSDKSEKKTIGGGRVKQLIKFYEKAIKKTDEERS